MQRFYPVGWSPGHAFAFVVEGARLGEVNTFPNIYGPILYQLRPSTEELSWTLVIEDLRTDNVLWAYHYLAETRPIVCRNRDVCSYGQFRCLQCAPVASSATSPRSFEEFWSQGQAWIREKLSEYGIQPGEPFELREFPIRYGGDEITVRVDTRMVDPEEEKTPVRTVSHADVRVISLVRGEKSVYSYRAAFGDAVVDLQVLGYLSAPWATEAALLVVELNASESDESFMGILHQTNLRVIGSTLMDGFK